MRWLDGRDGECSMSLLSLSSSLASSLSNVTTVLMVKYHYRPQYQISLPSSISNITIIIKCHYCPQYQISVSQSFVEYHYRPHYQISVSLSLSNIGVTIIYQISLLSSLSNISFTVIYQISLPSSLSVSVSLSLSISSTSLSPGVRSHTRQHIGIENKLHVAGWGFCQQTK